MNIWIQLKVGLLLGLQRCASSEDDGPFSGLNYAMNKNATQEPDTLMSYIAPLAVDGNTDGDFIGGRSCSHTLGSPSLPSSWTVDIGFPLYVTGILIYNRRDLRERLKSFKIFGLTRSEKEVIYDDKENNLYRQYVINTEINATKTYTAIQIWIPARVTENENVLTLCEVEVYGVPGCEPPTLESHVQMSSSPAKYTIGSSIGLTCATGYTSSEYTSSENETVTCSANSTWDGVQPTCSLIMCQPPEILENGYYLVLNETECDNLNYLCKIKAHCNEGYRLKNQSERICTSNGNWSDDVPICSIVQCNVQDLGKVANGYYVLNANNEPNTGFATYLQTASVVCTQGFILESDSTATCTLNGTWSSQKASCTIVTCLAPRETADIKYKIWHNTSYGSFANAFPFGSFSEVICEKGILKAGSRIRHCTIDGFWDGYDPVCVPLCSAPEATNGILRDVNNTRLEMYEEGQTLSLTCFEGFTSKTGQKILTCQKNHSWNSSPICENIPEKTDSHIAVIGGLGGGLAIAAIVAAGAFLFHFVQRKKSQEADLYTSLHAQEASNVEREYAKIQETVVT